MTTKTCSLGISKSLCTLLKLFLIGSIGLISTESAWAQPAGFADQVYVDNFTQAVGLTFDANGRMYVYEKGGKVWIVENGVKSPNPLIDISEEVGNWRDFGLLGFVLDPNFLSNGHIYLLYVVDRHHLMNFGTPAYNSNTNEYFNATIGRITRYTAQAATNYTTVNYGSRDVLVGETLSTGPPILHQSHGTGALVFGTDGTLLASLGDGASYGSVDQGSAGETYFSQALTDGIITSAQNVGAYRCQQLSSMNGKVLRIDPITGDGLPSNPYFQSANPGSNRSKVWARGLRNPCRMTMKPETGSHNPADGNPGIFYIGDVGWGTREELNVMDAAGLNFGWPKFEGMTYQPGYNNSSFTPGTHELAKLDWRSGTPRGSINGTIYNVGSSQISGPSFQGNCSIGGVWYNGTDFPAAYQNSYFHADYGGEWIKQFSFDANNNPTAVADFMTGTFGIVFVGTSPVDGGLYYIGGAVGNSNPNINSVRKVSYVGGNLPPKAVASVDLQFGSSPLTVQFVGDQSYDPDNNPLTYAWNFGDGSTISNEVNPSHVFTTGSSSPVAFNVTLTVTDNGNLSDQKTLSVALNNTPPNIISTSIDNINTFSSTNGVTLNLSAVVNDSEHSNASLTYNWITELHHNDHFHAELGDSNPTTTTELSPVGCDGATYWYRIKLIVTDPAGLSTLFQKDIFPNCSGSAQNITFGSISDKLTNSSAFTVNPSASSGLPVILHIVQGPATVSGNTISVTGLPGTVIVRAIQSGNNVYAPAIPVEQSFQVSRPGGGTGLSGNYFNNMNFTAPVLDRIDPVIDFDWGLGSPDPSIGVETFSIRWEGELLPLYSETYTFRTITDDGVRLWVNNQLVIDQWIDQAPTVHTGTISLTANQKVPIKMEFYENGGGASAKLEWSSSSQSLEVVPQYALFPIVVDNTAPTVSLSTANTNVSAPFSVAVNFSEAVSGLSLSDFTVSNGSKSALTGSGQTYSFTVSPTADGTVNVSLPANRTTDAAGNGNTVSNTLTVTYSTGGGGCNTPINLALNKPAVLSSPYSGGGAGAELAVDGNTNGNWWLAFSVASTSWANEPSWEVDLGEISDIEELNIWNRTDCCSDFLSNYYVLVSDVPFSSGILSTVLNQAGVSNYLQSTAAGTPSTVAINRSGRYVRLQKSGAGFMTLAEVEVMGCPGSGGDVTPPTASLTTASNNVSAAFSVTTTFSEVITGLTLSDFTVSNGTKSNLSGNGMTYSFIVTPTAAGNVSIQLPANRVTDAAGNPNTVSNTLNVNYTPGPTCDNITNAGSIVGDQTNCDPFDPTNISNQAHATGGSGARQYQWQQSTASPSGPWVNLSANTAGYNPGAITQTTWYRRGARRENCSNYLYSNAVIKEVDDCSGPTNYCTAQGQEPWIEWIENINFGSINNTSSKDLYGDFTNLSTDINRGASYPITLTHRFSWTTHDEYWRVWIDWNQDGDFTDSGEEVVSLLSSGYPIGTTLITSLATINVPTTATLGSTRMRIAMKRDAYAGPCETFPKGEVEDYSVNVLGTGEPQDQTINFPIISPQVTSSPAFTISATATSGLPVSFTIVSGPGTINGSTITLNGTAGTVTVQASQAGNAQYNPAPNVLRFFEIIPAADAPSVVINTPAQGANITGSSVLVNYTITGDLAAFGADHLLLQLDNQAAIDIHNLTGTYTFNNVVSGAHTITATLADENHVPFNHPEASDEVNFNTTGGLVNQTINFPLISDKLTTDPAFGITATASSGLPVNFEVSTGPATVSGNTITLNGNPGIVTIRAFQNGNSQYNPAPDVYRSFNVTSPNTGSYCTSNGQEPWQQWIGNVSFGNINSSSGKSQYSDFTALSTTVEQGSSYPISLQANFSWSQFSENFRVWIDFNQDGDFGDAGEQVFSQVAPAGTPPNPIPPVTGSISIPANAVTGTTRMRVSMKQGIYANPCESFQYGEVEDYSIVINVSSTSVITSNEEVLFLTAVKNRQKVRINWVTNTEYKNDYFQIERSTDGVQFEKLRTVNSMDEESRLPVYYQEFDDAPFLGLTYYRVKVFFRDGTSRYSPVEMVLFDLDTSAFSIFPNPAQEEIYVNLKKHEGKSAEIQIYNMKGQPLLTQKIGFVPNDPFRVDLSQYQNGIYTITIQVEDLKRISRKFVVSKTY